MVLEDGDDHPRHRAQGAVERGERAGAVGVAHADPQSAGLDLHLPDGFKDIEEIDISGQEPRVGVFICNCGTNIAGVLDVPGLQEAMSKLGLG